MTVDDEFKSLNKSDIEVLDHTRDACDKEHTVRIVSATDPHLILEPGQTRYFKLRKLGRSGQWHWLCGDQPEQARLSGATYIKAVRKANGVIDWYKVKKK